MRSGHWLAVAIGVAVLAAGVVKWCCSRPHPPLPADLTRQESAGPMTIPPAAAPPRPTAPQRPFEPIAVLPEPFTDPAASSVDVSPGGSEESEPAASVRPGPRPESSVLRMPYADEELSEFALLLQRAGEWRRQATPDRGIVPVSVSGADISSAFDTDAFDIAAPSPCPFVRERAAP